MQKTKLNNGVEIPIIGFGLYKMEPGEQAQQAISWALEAGYRHIDTASRYRNEKDVGIAIQKSGIPRKEIFVTTKLWNDGHDDPIRAFNRSLDELNLDYVDMYLMHWPVKERLKTWDAIIHLLETGKTRAIGVCNFMVRHLEELLEHSDIKPVVNQVEFNPYIYQKELLEFCRSKGIQLEAYAPLSRGTKLSDPKLLEIAGKYRKSPAQILLRWAIQKNIVVIPKSKSKDRIIENLDVFDFSLKDEDVRKLDRFNENLRQLPDPDQYE